MNSRLSLSGISMAALAGMIVCSLPLQAANNPDTLPVLKPKVRTLAAFKNGLGFVFKSGEVQLKDGWAQTDQLPNATLGSLWIGTTSKTGSITDVVSFKQSVSRESAALTQSELLAANVGKTVKLSYYQGNALVTVEGVLLSVPTDRKPEEPQIDPLVSARTWRQPPELVRGEIVLLRVTEGNHSRILSINRSLIQTVELADGSNLNTALETEVARAKVHVGGNPKSAEITMAYLEKGIVWSPSYRVNIENEKMADLTLEAVLANDDEDLDNVDVTFVVGYPNFLYADMLSPLTLQQSVAGFIQSLMTDRQTDRYSRFGNVMSQSIAYNSANFDNGRADGGYSVSQPMPGDASADLYFYRKSGVTLKKGDRARYTVFNAQVPYEHVYLWDIPDSMNVDDRGYRQDSGNRNKEVESQVWHVLRLENATKQPWTTAPAFTMNGSLPVAQDALNYAPPGGKSTLKLTVATDIRAEQSQTEMSRKTVNLDNRSFEDITVAGKTKIKNYKSKEVCVVVKKSLVGEVLSAEADGKVTRQARKLTSINPNSEIEWEFHLPAGQEKEVNYQYKVLVYR